MADSYRGRSRRSESSSGSSSSGGSHQGSSGHYHQATSQSSGHSNLSYPPIASGQYAYYPAPPMPGQGGPPSSQSSYGHYTNVSPSASPPVYGHHYASSSNVPRHSTYPGPETSASASERASKRQRAGTASDQATQAPWADASAQGYSASRGSHSSRRADRESSASSGYNSPGYSHRSHHHDPYGQQLLQPPSSVPGVGPSTIRDPHLYGGRHSSRHGSSDEDDEHVDHGPTELPPRTYSGKSQYDPPKKPGKIPGSAMDYLPILEARFDRLETAIDKYVDYRGQRALSNSILPGTDEPEGSSSREGSSSSRYSRGSSRR